MAGEPVATKEMCAFCFDVLQYHFDSNMKTREDNGSNDANGNHDAVGSNGNGNGNGKCTPPEERFDDAHCPLFVTWNIRSKSMMASLFGSAAEEAPSSTGSSSSSSGKKEGRLRGCIGTLEGTRLHTGLREYALISSLRDRR